MIKIWPIIKYITVIKYSNKYKIEVDIQEIMYKKPSLK